MKQSDNRYTKTVFKKGTLTPRTQRQSDAVSKLQNKRQLNIFVSKKRPMRRRDHYTISTWRDCDTIIIQTPIIVAFLLGCLFFLYNEFRYPVPRGKGIWFLFIPLLIIIVWLLYGFFHSLWKKRHLENIIYLDVSTEGIFLNPKLYSGKVKPTFLRWEEIEYLDVYYDKLTIRVHIKPDQKRKPVEIEFAHIQSCWRLRRAIRGFSGRKDIIRRFSYGLFSVTER